MTSATQVFKRRTPRFSSTTQVVLADAMRQLRKSNYHQLTRVDCDFHAGVLTLRGTVSSYYLKQIAQSRVRRIPGVESIVNRLQVTPG